MNDVYARIEALCKSRGMNITEMCRMCAIPRASLTDFKMGRIKTLSASTLQKIAEYFSVSVEYLLSGAAPQTDELNTSNLKIALFGGEDGLDFYRAVSRNFSPALAKGGALAFEVGLGQFEDVMKIMEEAGYRYVQYRCDLAGIERVVWGPWEPQA